MTLPPSPPLPKPRSLGPVLKDAWRLAVPYFKSEERWSAWLLLLSVVALNLLIVAVTVVLNYWNGAFYDSLQNKDWDSFISLLLFYRKDASGFMPGFVPIVTLYIPIAIYRTYLNQWLQIRWRRWMTQRLLADWLSDRAYYTISLTTNPAGTGTDNPDQRIADDLRSFVEDTLRLGLGLLSNIVSLANFALILWTLSGVVTVLGIRVPGYMLWAAVLYAIVGSYLTQRVGRPLAMLEFNQQKVEADFRYALVRLRENTEGVALYGGEREENASLLARFYAVMGNFRQIMQRQKLLNALISAYEQAAVIFPIIVAAPRYFRGEIALGGLTRTAGAFARVQGSLSWFIEAYTQIAAWRATVSRLASFRDAITTARRLAEGGMRLAPAGDTDLAVRDATLALPDGSVLLDGASLRFSRGQSTVISGRSGTGKSTLFRALAGIWPYGSGTVERPPGQYLFLPQRPYIPLGTLRHAVTYPGSEQAFPDAAVRDALRDSGLPELLDRLDEEQPWAQRHSGGEQQRLAVARALLLRPDWLFLDEATASLDPEAESELYRILRERLPDTTMLSIAHRPAVAAFHDQSLVFQRTPGTAGLLRPAKPA